MNNTQPYASTPAPLYAPILLFPNLQSMKPQFIWLYLFIIFCCHQTLFSQPVQKIQFNNIRKSEGLSNNMVNGLIRDNLGFLWIATNDGLCRYDGPNQLEIFRADEKGKGNSLASSNIRSIFEDSQQNLWIGTRLGGLTRYHQPSGSWKTFQHDATQPTTLSNDEVLTIMEDSQQRLWIGTENGLNLFDSKTETFTRFLSDLSNPFSLGGKAILDVFEDNKGWIWVGTWGGGMHLLLTDDLTQKELPKFRRINPTVNKPTHNVWKIYQDRQNRYWIGTHGGGLFLMQLPSDASNRLNKQKWNPQFHNYVENSDNPQSITSNSVQDILQDKKGKLWVATGYGLNCVEEKNMPDPKIYNSPTSKRPELIFSNFHFTPKNINSLAGDNVMNILEDEQGLLWFATANGISQFNWYTSQFDTHEIFTEGRKTTNAKNLHISNDSILWIGGGEYGLINYDVKNEQITSFIKKHSSLFLDDYVSSIYSKDKQWMYVATKLGLTSFNLETLQYKQFPTPEWLKKEITDFYVSTIFVDSNNRIWLGTEEGLYSINQKTGIYKKYLSNPNNSESISDNSINDIMEDGQGNLWIATFNGLNKIIAEDISDFKCKKFFFDKKNLGNTIIGNQVICLEVIGQKMFIGTTVGLCSYDLVTKQFIDYSTKEHKFWIQSIELTKDGNLWASTTQGLFYFDTKEEKINIFEKVDGLPDLSFLLGSSAQDTEGYIYFGNRGGFTRLHTGRFFKNTEKPKVYLTDIKKVNSSGKTTLNKSYDQELVMNHDDYYLSINFAALNYNRGEKNQYAYRLEGFDETWHYTEFGIPIVYTNLAPQTYTFRVKASNNDGVWNEEGASLTIIKHPAFWETWWFRIGITSLLFIGIIAVVNIYTKNIRKKNLVLKKYNDILNREIGERKKAEKALGHKEKFTRLIMDNIPQFIYWVDKEYTFLGGNHTFQELLSLKSETELTGKNLKDFNFSESFISNQKEILAEVIQTKKPIYNKIFQIPDNTLFNQQWIERSFIPLVNDTGQVIGMLVSGKDISDRIAKEKLIVENTEKLNEYNKELRRSNKDLEQFAYIASHDLKEPLRMIGNFSGLLARAYKTKLDQNAFEYIDFIEDGVRRMSNLINSLLTYSRVGRKEMKLRTIDLNRLIEIKLFDLSELIKDRNAKVEVGLLPSIFGEKEQIGMVFYNLVNNGIKFNKKEQPIISITSHKDAPKGYYKFSVSDNGIGIEPKYQQQIFEIFRRLHNKKDYEGTGIGLSVCQKIIFRHSGKIWLESIPGQGTTFYFTISKTLKDTSANVKENLMIGTSLS